MVANNSLEAYKKLKPELSGKRRAVYEMFCQHKEGATRQEISRRYNIAINSVCGRVNELIARGFLVEIGSKKDHRKDSVMNIPLYLLVTLCVMAILDTFIEIWKGLR